MGKLSDLLMKMQTCRPVMHCRCTETEAAALIVPVLRALAYLQDQSLVHGAICPSNIYITGTGQVKLGGIGSISFPELRSKNGSALTGWPWPPEHQQQQGKPMEPSPKLD
ncbi:MAG: hypothetical protein Q8P67_09825, partial [archaeon]|nr:hypothetical protein [archaeon]